MGNVYNRPLQLSAAIVRGLTCCKILARHWALRKIRSTKFPLGGGGEVNHIQPVVYIDSEYGEPSTTLAGVVYGLLVGLILNLRRQARYTDEYLHSCIQKFSFAFRNIYFITEPQTAPPGVVAKTVFDAEVT